MEEEDVTLMERIARGDRAALERLWGRHSGLVFTVGLRVLHDRQLAEDLVVEVFLELWTRADRYDRTRGRPVSYIATLARSRAIDRRRGGSAGLGRMSLVGLDQAGQITAHGDSALDGVLSDERSMKLKEAMKVLDPEQRQCLEMAYFSGLTHVEIAEAMKKPLGSIKTHIRQGCIRLRDLLRINRSDDV